MRILSVLSGYSSGGAETLARNLSAEFVRRGHECHIAVLSRAVDLGNSPEFEAEYMTELDEQGVTHEVIGHATRRNPFMGALRLRRAIQTFQPDLIHAHVGHALLYQAIGRARVPTVYTHHNIRLSFSPLLFRSFDRFVDEYVAICRSCEKMLRHHVRRPVRLIFNGVPSSLHAHPARKTVAIHPTVLSVGALTKQKDYSTLVRAAAVCVPVLAAQGRRLKFQIVGSGAAGEELGRVIAETNMADHVELLGTRSDIPLLMAKADLLANSSLYEGFPLALIEGSMAALPIVATRVGGNPEIVEDGGSGWLVPPQRPDLLAERIMATFLDREKYSAFSARALAVSEQFTLARCAESHLLLYDDVVGRRRAR